MDKFEMLNRKLDMIFETIEDLKSGMRVKEYEKKLELAKQKAEMAADDYKYKISDRHYISDMYDHEMKRYREINAEYGRDLKTEKCELI